MDGLGGPEGNLVAADVLVVEGSGVAFPPVGVVAVGGDGDDEVGEGFGVAFDDFEEVAVVEVVVDDEGDAVDVGGVGDVPHVLVGPVGAAPVVGGDVLVGEGEEVVDDLFSCCGHILVEVRCVAGCQLFLSAARVSQLDLSSWGVWRGGWRR